MIFTVTVEAESSDDCSDDLVELHRILSGYRLPGASRLDLHRPQPGVGELGIPDPSSILITAPATAAFLRPFARALSVYFARPRRRTVVKICTGPDHYVKVTTDVIRSTEDLDNLMDKLRENGN
jgi:hypothetical protein